MDRRNQPVSFWGDSVGFWCRLWQLQIEQSMRFWGAWTAQMPHPSAANLAAEAETLKEICQPSGKPAHKPKAGSSGKSASGTAAKARAAEPMH